MTDENPGFPEIIGPIGLEQDITGISVDINGSLLVADSATYDANGHANGAVFGIDANTGSPTVISRGGIFVEPSGIVVDDHCRTDDPDIFAVGDCTAHPSDQHLHSDHRKYQPH